MLDQCLGAHSEIASLGEIHWLPAYCRQDRQVYDPDHPLVCSCGESLETCPFWSAVATALGRPLSTLQLHPKFAAGDESGRTPLLNRLPRRLLRSAPVVFRFRAVRGLMHGKLMAHDSIALFDAVHAVTGKRLCVDSSKSPLRFRAVFGEAPATTYAVVLSRDFRAVVHSKMKRGAKFEVAALGWRRKMHQIDVLTSDAPRDRVHFMSYEDLCTRPREELSRVCEFLGVRFEETMLERPTQDIHHIGGSPSKFDAARTRIQLDRTFVDRFRGEELERLRSLVGDQAARWGY